MFSDTPRNRINLIKTQTKTQDQARLKKIPVNLLFIHKKSKLQMTPLQSIDTEMLGKKILNNTEGILNSIEDTLNNLERIYQNSSKGLRFQIYLGLLLRLNTTEENKLLRQKITEFLNRIKKTHLEFIEGILHLKEGIFRGI